MKVITAHIDRQKNKAIDGVTFTNTHSGQKRPYGDSFYEYEVTSDRPAEEVERVCRDSIYKCGLTEEQWRKENRENPSMDNHFRSHYVFKKTGDGKYFYQVCFPFAD
jgi:hypothetical protein